MQMLRLVLTSVLPLCLPLATMADDWEAPVEVETIEAPELYYEDDLVESHWDPTFVVPASPRAIYFRPHLHTPAAFHHPHAGLFYHTYADPYYHQFYGSGDYLGY